MLEIFESSKHVSGVILTPVLLGTLYKIIGNFSRSWRLCLTIIYGETYNLYVSLQGIFGAMIYLWVGGNAEWKTA